MFKLLKKYFIPHKHNDHKPHILRYETILVILTIALIAEIYFLAQVFVLVPFTDIFSSVLPSTLTDLTNLNRKNDNLSMLKVNPILSKAAELKAQDMAAKGYFAHESPEGKTPWYWLDEAGYEFITAGENLAVNFVDSQDLSDAWMNSPTHRANILNNNFTQIGIATAKGVYQGKETIFVAQFFGRPADQKDSQAQSDRPASITQISPKISPAPSNAPQIIQQKNPENKQESFALVMGESETIPITPAPSAKIESENSASADRALSAPRTTFLSKIQQLLSTPRAMTNYLFVMLLTIVSLALILKIFIKIKIQHVSLIANGLLTLLFISSLMWVNQFLTLSQAKIF